MDLIQLFAVIAPLLVFIILRFYVFAPVTVLSHQHILDLLKRLDHPHFEGVCFGFSLNWAQAVALDQQDIFYQQIDFIRRNYHQLPSLIKDVRYKVEQNIPLTKEAAFIHSVDILLKNICITQSPDSYRDTYGKRLWQSDMNNLLLKISPSKVHQVFFKTHTFATRHQAADYFNYLIEANISPKIAVMISTADHAMGFVRHEKKWRFVNINTLYQQSLDYPYSQLSSEQMIDELFKEREDYSPFNRRLTVNTDFIGLNSHGYHHLFNELEHSFPRVPQTTDGKQYSYFSMAALQGDMNTVRSCIKAGLSIFRSDPISHNAPIVVAIQQGRQDVVRVMLGTCKHRVNYANRQNLSTLLHIACRNNNSGIVKDLLDIPSIQIDPKDNMGMTPLMHACKLSGDDQLEIIGMLLARKASLTAVDKENRTALDHAKQHDKTDVIELLEDHLSNLNSKKPNPLRVSGTLYSIHQSRSFMAQPVDEPDSEDEYSYS